MKPVAEQNRNYVNPSEVAKKNAQQLEEIRRNYIKELENNAVKPVVQKSTEPSVEPTEEYVAAEKPVNVVSAESYQASVPQETPVYSAFETMQNRLPLTRKAFDTEDF